MSNSLLERQAALEEVNERSYENYKELLDSLRLEVVMGLDIQRQFIFSYLISKKVLDDEDCEQITNSGATRQQRVSCFLDIIRRKGSSGIKHFIDALEFENPALYKAFTGKTATAFMAPLIPSGRAWDCISGLPAKEYIDSDRAMLSNQLEQRIKDYHCMVMQLNRSQEEKNIVEKKLMEAQLKIDQLQQCIEQLKESLLKSPCGEEDKNSFLVKLQEKELKFYHQISKRTEMIMALQSKLLAQTEEIDEKNQQCHHLKEENKLIKRMADDLKLKLSVNRKLTRKFSEQSFNTSSSSSQELKEMQIELQRSAEECRILKEENQEFLKFSDLLNTKFKMLVKENSELKAYNKQISCAFENMNANYEECKSQCKELEWSRKCLEEVNARLEKNIKLYQDIQVAQKIDCDRLLEEKNKLFNAMVESKQKIEEGLQKQVNINESLEEQYRQVTNELNEVRNTLQQTVKELNETKKSLSLEPENLQSFMSKSCDSKNVFEVVGEQSESMGSVSNTFEMEENMNDELTVKDSKIVVRKRSSKDLLDSMRRKFSSNNKNQMPNTPSINSLMSFQQLQLLFPTFLRSSTSDHFQSCYDEIRPQHVQIQNLYFQNTEDMSLMKDESICQEKMELIANKYDSENDSSCMLLTSKEDVSNSSSPVVFRRRALLLGEKEHSWRARRGAQIIVSF